MLHLQSTGVMPMDFCNASNTCCPNCFVDRVKIWAAVAKESHLVDVLMVFFVFFNSPLSVSIRRKICLNETVDCGKRSLLGNLILALRGASAVFRHSFTSSWLYLKSSPCRPAETYCRQAEWVKCRDGKTLTRFFRVNGGHPGERCCHCG